MKSLSFFSMPEGPIYPILTRLGWAPKRPAFILLRLIIITAALWIPLAICTFAQGAPTLMWFLRDFATHIRFLIAVPIFLTAGLIIEPNADKTLNEFIQVGIISEDKISSYRTLIARTGRWVNSHIETTILVVLVIAATQWGSHPLSPAAALWKLNGDQVGGAGLWFHYVSRPVFQFLLLRWFWRVLIWDLLLFKISRLELELIPTHPDHSAGLGFLGLNQVFFAPIILSLAAIMAGDIGERILYQGAALRDQASTILIFIALLLIIFLLPLVVFLPRLARARRVGQLEYGVFASHYVRRFQKKWLPGQGSPKEELLGSGDIQSLADLGNSFNTIQKMRLFPIDRGTFMLLAISAAMPFVPLLLTVFTPKEILQIAKSILL